MDVIVKIVDDGFKFVDSHFESTYEAWEERVRNGLQPVLPFQSREAMIRFNIAYIIITAVLYFIMSKKAEPFKLKPLIAVYNVTCILLAAACFFGTIWYKLQRPGFWCNTTDPANHPEDISYHFVFWLFYVQKYWEYMDTWFFLLRKSFRQVTFLHLYHHTSISVVVGSASILDWAGDIYLPVLLNSFVHIMMYSHYLMTSLGIQSWWRQYLTSAQILQFFLIGFQNVVPFLCLKECPGFASTRLFLFCYMITMIVLFADFYIKAYCKPTSSSPSSSKKPAVEEKKEQ